MVMVRALIGSSSLLLLVGCGDVDVDDGGNPFASATDGTAGTAPVATSAATEAEGTSAPATSEATGESGPSTAPGSEGTTTTEPPSTTGDESGQPGESSGNPGDGGLGECVGTGAWESCAQYCSAVLDTCVEAGCGGATVHYYNDVGACTAMETDSTSAQPCDEPFQMGGGISFARCCCA